MPIRTQCPSCKMVLRAPDGPPGQRVRCPSCATAFKVKEETAALPEVLPSRPTIEKEGLQTGKAPRPTPARLGASPPSRERREPSSVRKSPGVPVWLIAGIGIGVFGLFVLAAGGIALIWFLSPSDGPPPRAPEMEPVAQVKPQPPDLEPARQNIAGPQGVPEAPLAVEGGEEFVDLPERGEDLPGVAGLNPEPQPGLGMPTVRPRIALTKATVVRRAGQPHLYFEVDYRFVQGAPAEAVRYTWVIAPARGPVIKLTLNPDALRARGTLRCQPPVSPSRLDAPYRIYLMMGLPGAPEEIISNELTLR